MAFPTYRKPTRRTQAAKRDLFEIHDRVKQLAAQVITAGLQPTEVWLGPEEAETVRRGLESDPGFYRTLAPHQSQTLEGSKLSGLTIRLAAKPGIRVGVTVG